VMSGFGSSAGAPVCPNCTKRIYPTEIISAAGRQYHKQCIICKKCSRKITPGSQLDHKEDIYCKNCYNEEFVDSDTQKQVYDSIKCSRAKDTTDQNGADVKLGW